MTGKEAAIYAPITRSISIHAAPAAVWKALTDPALMKQWMSETEIEIITTWEVGSPVIIRGDWYKTGFRNTGKVLRSEQEQVLCYSHLSSLSRLPDLAENYTILEFRLTPEGDETLLEVILSNFPTEAIYRHLAFYWNVAPALLKKLVEQKVTTAKD